MTSLPDTSPRDGGKKPTSSLLPQYGFGSHTDFRSLVEDNHFLFRVYTPKDRSPFFDDSEPFFIGTRFDERFRETPDELRDWDSYGLGPLSEAMGYPDVARHLTWTTRTESPLISANFSFSWSVWDALRRYHASMKKDIQIAVIDAHQVAHKAATALELMQKDAPPKKDKEYWKWRRYALESQLVFVHGSIPGSAVYASIPLLAIVEKLPTYFLLSELDTASPADLAWDYREKRSSYHAFCQLMSERFLKLSPESRVRDTTAGAVRLAVTFLRPWFHAVVAEDFPLAVSTASELAFAVAYWPGRWWARDKEEVWLLIRALVRLLAEELREAHNARVTKEVEKLETTLHALEEQVEKNGLSPIEEDHEGEQMEEEERLKGVIADLEEQLAHYQQQDAERKKAEEEKAQADSARMQEIIDSLEEKVRAYEQDRVPGTPSLMSDSSPEYATPGSPGYFGHQSSYFASPPDWPLTPPISPYVGPVRARSGSDASIMSELSIMPRAAMTTPPPMKHNEPSEPTTPPQQRGTPSMLPTPPSTLPRPRNRVTRMPTDPGEASTSSSPFMSAPHGKGVGHVRSMSLTDMHKAMSLSLTPDMLLSRTKSPAPSFASMAPDLSPLREAPELPPLRGPVSFPRPLTPESSLDSRASSRAPSRSASLYERGSLHERQGSWPERKGSLSRHTRSRSSSIISMGSRPVNLMEMFDKAPSHAVMEDDVVPEVAGIEQLMESEEPVLEDQRPWVERPRRSSVLLTEDSPRPIERLGSVSVDTEEREIAARRMDAPLSAVTEEGPGLDALDIQMVEHEDVTEEAKPQSPSKDIAEAVHEADEVDDEEEDKEDTADTPKPQGPLTEEQARLLTPAVAGNVAHLIRPSIRAVLPILFVPASIAVHAVHRAIYDPIRVIEVVPELAAAITTAAQALVRLFGSGEDAEETQSSEDAHVETQEQAEKSEKEPSTSTTDVSSSLIKTPPAGERKLPVVIVSSPSASRLSLEEAWTLVDELVPGSEDSCIPSDNYKTIAVPNEPLMIGWETSDEAHDDSEDLEVAQNAQGRPRLSFKEGHSAGLERLPSPSPASPHPRDSHAHNRPPRPPIVIESVSYVAAGFLLGAVFAVSLMSMQRRAAVVVYGSLT